MDLAARLRSAIEAIGQTQSWVAARSNVPEETISRIVTRETKNPQVGTLMKLAPVLGVTVGWLLGEKNAAFSDDEARTLARAIDILRGRLQGTAIDPRERPNALAVAKTRGADRDWEELASLPVADIPRDFAMRGAKWVVRARGDSMSGRGIRDGDLLYVRPVADVRHAIGEIVVGLVAGALFAKRLEIAADRIKLVSENERYEPMLVDEISDEFALLGIVVGRAGEV
jgi:transcriptional regulator with XRE-family HTH domain